MLRITIDIFSNIAERFVKAGKYHDYTCNDGLIKTKFSCQYFLSNCFHEFDGIWSNQRPLFVKTLLYDILLNGFFFFK